MSMIACHNLSRAYDQHWAVRNIDFRVPTGSVCALVGPNGAGKSSTIKMMATLLEPTGGRITIDGHDVVTDRDAVRRKVGYLPDHFTLYEDMTVTQCLSFYGACYDMGRTARARRVAELVDLLDLRAKVDAPISGLSRGMKQRVGLARALFHDPPVLLLDEPASGLDPAARIALRKLFVRLKEEGKTLLVSSHVLTELNTFCDAIVILQQGRVLESGRLSDVQARLSRGRLPYTVTVVSGMPLVIACLEQTPGVEELTMEGDVVRFSFLASRGRAAELLTRLVQTGAAIDGLERGKQDLEWVYQSISADRVN